MDGITKKRYNYVFLACLFIAVSGIVLGDWRTIPQGFVTMFFDSAILITDYIVVLGTAATFMNVALVMFFSALLMRINNLPMNGKSYFALGLMAGFAFFGKNIYTMWFILFGTWILSKVTGQSFGSNLIVGLLVTSLGPIISTVYLHNGVTVVSLGLALLVGIVIGFVSPLLATHTAGILKGMSLYNVGFTSGLVAYAVVPVLMGFNYLFENENTWATGYNFKFGVYMYFTAALCILIGFLADRENAWNNYKNLLKRPGVAKDDFTELDGLGAVMINMGVNALLCTSYLLLIGGDLNGPTLGCIFTVMGFSANGKHIKNITPVVLGVCLGAIINPNLSPRTHGMQMAVFLATTLAPLAGTYGIIGGMFAGALHSFTVTKIGLGYGVANLYNNGFCGGIISIFCYPVFDRFFKKNTYSTPSESQERKKTALENSKAAAPGN